jgi:hypothetical protein
MMQAQNTLTQSLSVAALIAEQFSNARFCGFKTYKKEGKTVKHPLSLQGQSVGKDVLPDLLVHGARLNDTVVPQATHWGVYMQKPIEHEDGVLWCIDIDYKNAIGDVDPRITAMVDKARDAGILLEMSHSGRGAHLFVIAPDDHTLPAKITLAEGQEIELFGHTNASGKSVMLTGDEMEGELNSYDDMRELLNTLGIDDETIDDETIDPPKPKALPTPIYSNGAYTQNTGGLASEVLRHVHCYDDYDNWLKVGMAIKSELGDGGFNEWDQWSKQSSKYDPKVMEAKWRSFKGNGVGFGTVVKMAKDSGYQPARARVDVKRRVIDETPFDDDEATAPILPDAVNRALTRLAIVLKVKRDALESDIGFDAQIASNSIEGCAYDQNKSKFMVMAPEGDLRMFLRGDLLKALRKTFGAPYDRNALGEMLVKKADEDGLNAAKAKDFIGANMALIDSAMIDHILIERQFGNLDIDVDMFAKRAKIDLWDGCAKITFPHLEFAEGAVDQDVIADYKSHFPEFDEFLDMLVGARFALSRKKAYLWIKAPSDWGKGTLSKAMADHGLVVGTTATEVELIFSGRPVGKLLSDFKRAWVIEFNEHKTTKGELKQLEQEIAFSPKGLPQCKAQLYLKLFFSAEDIDSLASENSGIEDQFANRFSMLAPQGRIVERVLFEQSHSRYIRTLTNYVGQYLNARVQEYRALGRQAAHDKGDKAVGAWHTKHGITNTYQRLSDKIGSLSEQFLEWIKGEYVSALRVTRGGVRGLSKIEREVLENSFVKDGALYVKRPSTLIDTWLESEFNQSERGKLSWKRSELKQSLPEVKQMRFNCDTFKVMHVAQLSPQVMGLLPSEGKHSDYKDASNGV